MALFLDSVDSAEVQAAADLGCLAGVTTNPLLIAQSGLAAEEIIRRLCAIAPGIVFHQLTADDPDGLDAEAERFLAIAPGRVGLKIPCRHDGIRLASRFASRAVCAVTAVYSPAQAYLAAESGARYVIPYVNRAGRQGLDALELVRALAAVVAAVGRDCTVLGASIKSPGEAVDVLRAGARHITVPWAVLTAMVDHPLTTRALVEFAAVGEGR